MSPLATCRAWRHIPLLVTLSLVSLLPQTGTQKTLNIVNQTIPIVKQLNPVFKNAKTMFKIMNEFKKNDTPVNNQTNDLNAKQESTKKEDTISVHKYNNNSPTFFL